MLFLAKTKHLWQFCQATCTLITQIVAGNSVLVSVVQFAPLCLGAKQEVQKVQS